MNLDPFMGHLSHVIRLCNPFLALVEFFFVLPASATPPIVFQNPCTEFGPVAIVASELNGDSAADLVVANFFADSVSVLLGEGDATFRPTMNYAVGPGPMALAVDDLTLDGHMDIVVTSSGADDLRLLRGRGDGTFAAAAVIAADIGFAAVAVGDIDDDRIPDIVVADAASDVVTVLEGDGTGKFVRVLRLSVPEGAAPVALALGDLKRDGATVLAVANRAAGSISIFAADPAHEPAQRMDYPVGGSPVSLDIADATGDGQFDIIVADRRGNAAIVVSDTPMGFTPARHIVRSVPVLALARDLNGDMVADLVTVNSFSDSVTTLAGIGGGEFEPGVDFSVGTTPLGAAVVDLNGDRKPDLITVNFDDDDCTLLLNLTSYDPLPGDADGNGRLSEQDRELIMAEFFDGDGRATFLVHRGYLALDARADVNSDGHVSSADLVALVGQVR